MGKWMNGYLDKLARDRQENLEGGGKERVHYPLFIRFQHYVRLFGRSGRLEAGRFDHDGRRETDPHHRDDRLCGREAQHQRGRFRPGGT
jgi:hypothetical protein